MTTLMTTNEKALVAALLQCERLIKEALPKFDWGASALDANALDLLNTTPGVVNRALAPYRTRTFKQPRRRAKHKRRTFMMITDEADLVDIRKIER